MAGAGMALRRGSSHNTESGDDVQRSIELLDRVLSEFDDVENANQVQNIQQMTTSTSTPQLRQAAARGAATTPPDDESPSLGHQSEDDGYMSMNGRKAKFNLAFRPLVEAAAHQEAALEAAPALVRPGDPDDFPPPPEEAQRLISTLLPKVSPERRSGRSPITSPRTRLQFPLTQINRVDTIPPPQKFGDYHVNGLPDALYSTTQTTLPKTRHQRPHGREAPAPAPHRFGSLPFAHAPCSPTRVPPRTVPSAPGRHRAVTRHRSADELQDDRFSDDSLEELPPPPGKRASVAWEVPLDAVLAPGSTRVVGRRRRQSGSCSSTGSAAGQAEEWPEPPVCADDASSPFSDSDDQAAPPCGAQRPLSATGTYVVRKKDRQPLLGHPLLSPGARLSVDLPAPRPRLGSPRSRLSLDLSGARAPAACAHSATFDSLQALVREAVEEQCAPPAERVGELPACQPQMVRVVSLPSLGEPAGARRELDVTVEEEEDGDSSQQSGEMSPLRRIEHNISELLERRDIQVVESDARCILNGVESLGGRCREKKRAAPAKPGRRAHELQKSSSHNEIQRSEDYYRQLLIDGGQPFPKRNGIQKSESAKEMLIAARSQLTGSASGDFPVRVEVLDFPPLPPSPVEEDDEYMEIPSLQKKTRADTLPSEPPPLVPPHRDPSLTTRSMDACSRSARRPHAGRPRRRAPHSPPRLPTSCSLPETPVFARGCDVPRTPHRRAPDAPGSLTAPRPAAPAVRRGASQSGLERAIVGAELLRLAGGPQRGWYPKQRQRRPASIEHLDRLGAHGAQAWDAGRKPLTLPPNLTPKFFQRSPRDALRRVTSLLIRKGNNGKEQKKDKEVVSPTTIHENANGGGEEVQKKKGFFRSFWKRSRHYSLEQQ